MAYKFVLALCALFGAANAGSIFAPAIATYAAAPAAVVARIANPSVDAVGTTHQNVVRSFGGTVSTYSKAVDTPYSSVRKVDSRITNNVYTPALAKTVTTYAAAPAVAYAAPVIAKTVVAAAPVAHTYAAAPVAHTYAAAPVAHTYAAAPVAHTYAATPVAHTYAAAPVAHAYAAAPAVFKSVAPAYVRYSPAVSVAHVSFNGFGSHWGY